MRRTMIVLLLWLCTACVLTTVHGRSLPWLKDNTQKRQKQTDIGGRMCQVDIRNCDFSRVRDWQKASQGSRSRQKDRINSINKRWLSDLFQRKDQTVPDELDQNRRR